VLHIGSAVHWPAPVIARILRAAGRLRRRGALVSVDLNIRPERTEALGETPGQTRLLLDRLLRSADVIRTSTGADRASSAIRAADAFTAGLLGALYQLKQKEICIQRLAAEDLTEMLDSAPHAAGMAVDGTLTTPPKYF
jgi:hypothetical protein